MSFGQKVGVVRLREDCKFLIPWIVKMNRGDEGLGGRGKERGRGVIQVGDGELGDGVERAGEL